MILCYHLEDSRYVGVWPSHAEGLARLAASTGAAEVWVVDRTPDGTFALPNQVPHRRLSDLGPLAHHSGPVVAVETASVSLGPSAVSLWGFSHPDGAVYVFGPHNGLQRGSAAYTHHVHVPVDLDVRDAISATLIDRHRKR